MIVRVNVLPAATDVGLSEEIAPGTGDATGTDAADEVPPAGAGLKTARLKVPPAATSASVSVKFTCPELANAVGRVDPFS